MTLDEELEGVINIFLDTAPVIYYVENHPLFADSVEKIISKLENRELQGVISPVTLAECLVYPFKLKEQKLQRDFVDFLLRHQSIKMIEIDTEIGLLSSSLRAKYDLKLLDALQVATAIRSGCEAILTNDAQFQRISELKILIVENYLEDSI